MLQLIRAWPVTSFYVLAYAITWACVMPLALSERGLIAMDWPHAMEMLGAFGPFIAAMLIARVLHGRAGPAAILGSFTRLRQPTFWWLFALLSPFGLLLAAFGGVWTFTGERPAYSDDTLARLASGAGLVDLIVIGGIIQGWGEEPGWRGFALPRLRERFGPLAATLALWPVWLCWHLPSFLARPEFQLVQFVGFAIGILSAAIWLTLIWDATHSVLLAAAWHATVNIARGLAQAMSVSMFLAFNNAVLLSALAIAGYWVMRRRALGPTPNPLAPSQRRATPGP